MMKSVWATSLSVPKLGVAWLLCKEEDMLFRECDQALTF